MKKIILSLVLVFVLSSSVFAESFDIPTQFIKITSIRMGTDSIILQYDNQTKIVYMMTGWRELSITPYYSANGKLCKYDEVSKKLVEVEEVK